MSDRDAEPSARSLLLTVLGEFVLPGGGTAWTSTLLSALGAVGVTEKTARQAISRSAEAGLLEAVRFGRRTEWHLTEQAKRVLSEGADRIYSFGRAWSTPEWDGRWVLLLTTIPETSRHLRYRLRTRLSWAGFAAIGPGDWISPWSHRADEAWAVIEQLGLDGSARLFVGELGRPGDPRQLASEAWALAEVAAAYDAFMATHRAKRPADTEQAFAALTLLVHECRRFPNEDPGLPPDLLPAGWNGPAAAELFHQLHDTWAPSADQWWAQL